MSESTVLQESSTPTLLPREEERLREEERRLSNTLSAPPHIANQIQDRRHFQKQLKDVRERLEKQSAKPYAKEHLDDAVKLEASLREKWSQGMPTQAEMRKNPAGAVGKHMAWEARNKADIIRWKNVQRRLHKSGDTSGSYEDPDASNIERFRPAGGVDELLMHGTAITGKQFYMPDKIEIKNTMSDDERVSQADEMYTTVKEMADKGDAQAKRILPQVENILARAKSMAEGGE